MSRGHVVLVSHSDFLSCRACECLPRILARISRGAGFQLVDASSAAGAFTSKLVLLRLCPSVPRNRIDIENCRKDWRGANVLGLICDTGLAKETAHDLDDFAAIPFSEQDLGLRVQRLLTRRGPKEGVHPGSMVGGSAIFRELIDRAIRMARSDATVLITGETGTGKEVFARAIHYQSTRSQKPFIPVNCGAMPDHLLENELFGHARGAFTDAATSEKGLFAEAEGGTFFFDEIDALSPAAQVKILRFLEDREYRPLGSPRSMVANVRIIAATNSDLTELIRRRCFREDLYHRLNVLSLQVAPLRERIEDVELLTCHFVEKYSHESPYRQISLSAASYDKLMSYEWPGNVRELERIVQRAMILSRSAVLEPEDFDIPTTFRKGAGSESFHAAKSRAIVQFERQYLTDLLIASRGNVTQAARAAGKHRRTLQRLIEKHGLQRQAYA